MYQQEDWVLGCWWQSGLPPSSQPGTGLSEPAGLVSWLQEFVPDVCSGLEDKQASKHSCVLENTRGQQPCMSTDGDNCLGHHFQISSMVWCDCWRCRTSRLWGQWMTVSRATGYWNTLFSHKLKLGLTVNKYVYRIVSWSNIWQWGASLSLQCLQLYT